MYSLIYEGKSRTKAVLKAIEMLITENQYMYAEKENLDNTKKRVAAVMDWFYSDEGRFWSYGWCDISYVKGLTKEQREEARLFDKVEKIKDLVYHDQG
jgi:hypothetical protein